MAHLSAYNSQTHKKILLLLLSWSSTEQKIKLATVILKQNIYKFFHMMKNEKLKIWQLSKEQMPKFFYFRFSRSTGYLFATEFS